MLFRWSYNGIVEGLNGEPINEQEAELIIANAPHLVKEYHPRLPLDHDGPTFRSGTYEYLN